MTESGSERRMLESVIYEREPPIARIILNRPDKANTKDASLVQEVDQCLHEADRDREIKVVILKANGKGFCGGHVARWGPDENPYPDFGTPSRISTREPPTCSCGRRCTCGSSQDHHLPDPRLLHGRRHLSGVTDRFLHRVRRRVLSDAAGTESREPGGHTMIEPWLMMNWHRTMDWLLLAPTLSAQEALEWGLLNKVVPRDDLEATVEDMARRIGTAPLTTLMAVKNNVKRAYELMGMRVHLQVSHILTNMVGAATDVQDRRAQLIQSGRTPRDFIQDEQT